MEKIFGQDIGVVLDSVYRGASVCLCSRSNLRKSFPVLSVVVVYGSILAQQSTMTSADADFLETLLVGFMCDSSLDF